MLFGFANLFIIFSAIFIAVLKGLLLEKQNLLTKTTQELGELGSYKVPVNSKINCLQSLYSFMGIKPCIYNINNVSNISNINNVYFLENKETYDINSILNSLIKNGLKKNNLNFFV